MFHSGCPSIYLRFLVLLALFFYPRTRGEVIYDNTTGYLGTYVREKREYGDQVDLAGTARRLTEILFEYYGQFEVDGDETVKVRLYTNERPYDDFRKEPTTLLYESEWLPISPGYGTKLVSGLNVLLPLHSVTFTVEFEGVGADEQVGLLFYGPPTEGYSFNEFWFRGASGNWVTVLYSTTDPAKRANVGLRLIALPEVVADQAQKLAERTVAMRVGTNRVRFAQTFTAGVSGRLDHLLLAFEFTDAPVRLRILDTLQGRPGPNVLGALNVLRGTGVEQKISLGDLGIYLKKGNQYAIEVSTAAEVEGTSYLVAVTTNRYAGGALWMRPEGGGDWTPATLGPAEDGFANLDAVFETQMVPAQPSAELLVPRSFDLFDLGEPILLRAQHKPPEIGTITRMRFFNGSQELGSDSEAPYEFVWTNAPAGEHNLRAVAEDSFRRPFRSDYVTILVRPGGAPQNDFFSQRVMLDGLSLRRIKPSAGATTEPNEPGLRTNNPAGATLWWGWTAYDASPVTISAQNSSGPGASVAVFTGSSLGSLELVAQGSPSVLFDPDAGVTYAISVDPGTKGDQVVLDISTGARITGHSIAGGNFSLRFTRAGNRSVRIEYSDDLITWRRAIGTIVSDGMENTWTDSGQQKARFYRVVSE